MGLCSGSETFIRVDLCTKATNAHAMHIHPNQLAKNERALVHSKYKPRPELLTLSIPSSSLSPTIRCLCVFSPPCPSMNLYLAKVYAHCQGTGSTLTKRHSLLSLPPILSQRRRSNWKVLLTCVFGWCVDTHSKVIILICKVGHQEVQNVQKVEWVSMCGIE